MKNITYTIKESDFIEYKKKRLSRDITTRLIKRGEIKRSSNCQLCNETKKTEAHHTDYGMPQNIMWLCDSCHGLAHRCDSIYNPKNVYQTPIPMAWETGENVTVSFKIPARNFIAIKKQAQNLKMPLSKLLREAVMEYYKIQSNQLNLNFEDKNEERFIAVI